MENWLTTGFELWFQWLETRSYSRILWTHWMGIPYWQPAVQLIIVGSLKIFDIPTHKVLEKHWRNFTSLKLSEFSQIPHPSPRVTSTFNSRKANHHSITPHTHPHPHTHTHTHTQTHTHTDALNYATSLARRLRESSWTPGIIQVNLGLTSLPHSFY